MPSAIYSQSISLEDAEKILAIVSNQHAIISNQIIALDALKTELDYTKQIASVDLKLEKARGRTKSVIWFSTGAGAVAIIAVLLKYAVKR